MNAFEKMLEIIITVVLLFLIPVLYMACRQDFMMQIYVQNEVIYFVDSVRNVGYLDATMYEDFEKRLNLSGNSYKIEMSYYEKKYESGTENSYYLGYYTQDIMEMVYGEESNTFIMHQGNSFFVAVENTNDTLAKKMSKTLFEYPITFQKISVSYGGMIRSEYL